MRYFRALALCTLLAAGPLGPHPRAHGGPSAWRVDPVDAPAPIAEIRQTARGAVLFRAGSQWHRLTACGKHLCQSQSQAPRADAPPPGGLPDGGVARFSGQGIVRAWYAEPTGRYDHGILGDRIEAGALVIEDHAGRRHVHTLPETMVFEDLTPRLADLDGDGRAEIVAIATSIDRGASLAVLALKEGRLRQVAATPPIGRTHRWLNVAGIADFNGDGATDIAVVTTPHIGGTLQIWSYRSGALVLTASSPGFSNHAIGSRNQGLSGLADADGDGLPDLIVPDASRRALRIVAVRGARLEPIASVALPGRVTQNIGVVRGAAGPTFVIGLEDGTLVAVTRP